MCSIYSNIPVHYSVYRDVDCSPYLHTHYVYIFLQINLTNLVCLPSIPWASEYLVVPGVRLADLPEDVGGDEREDPG